MKNIIILLLVFIAGCSSITKNMVLTSEGSPQSKIVVYRPWALAAGSNSMLIGFNDKYFGALNNKQYMNVSLNSGTYDFQVKASGSSASSLRVILKPNETTCLESNINPAAAGVMIIPLFANIVSWFQLSEVPCPSDDFYTGYGMVKKS